MEKKLVKQFILVFFGASLMTFSVVNFIVRLDLASTGFTGIKIIVYRIFGMNPGLVGYLINFPLLLLFYKLYNKKTFFMTIYGMLAYNSTLWFFSAVGSIVPDFEGFRILQILMGGALYGLGTGIVIAVGGTTGGSHIVGKVANLFLGTSVARVLLVFDVSVIALSLFFFLTPMNATLTVLSLLMASFVVSRMERLGGKYEQAI